MTPTNPNTWSGIIRRYAEFLPVSEKTPIVSLCEGNTPLIPAPNFVRIIDGNFRLFLKYEGLNPTASFKDRGMSLAISKACEKDARIVICASTGNTSASAAAYAARARLQCAVLLPHGNIAMGKLSQAMAHNARIIGIEGNFDDALRLVRELGKTAKLEIVNSINPVRIEGQKTAAFEICDQLGQAPDFHFLPVGNAGNITAYWRGFEEYHERKLTDRRPKMCGYQAAGAAPIVDGHPIENPETIATAIRIGNPASWQSAVAAAEASEGWIEKVTDEAIEHAYRLIAHSEGVFAEPACAAPLAGLIRCHEAGRIPEASTVTLTLTGHGLKDCDFALQHSESSIVPVKPNAADLLKALGL